MVRLSVKIKLIKNMSDTIFIGEPTTETDVRCSTVEFRTKFPNFNEAMARSATILVTSGSCERNFFQIAYCYNLNSVAR